MLVRVQSPNLQVFLFRKSMGHCYAIVHKVEACDGLSVADAVPG